MPHNAEFLFAIGSLLLLGLATYFLGKHTFLPRVTLLLFSGIIMGDEVLGLIPDSIESHFDIITDIALLMIGFLLGGKLTHKSLKEKGKQLISISLSAALATTVIVSLSLLIIGISAEISILLGCIAAATAPTATVDTVLEANSESPFSRLLVAIVAIDDIWALILFSFGLAFLSLFNDTQNGSLYLLDAAREIFGALLLGGLIGFPAAYLTGRISPGQPMLIEALGLIFICGGIAIWLEVSFLIAAMTMGAIIANLAKHHDYPFHEIENIEWPFMVLFFILAGATLEINMLAGLGLMGGVYVLARLGGKFLGAWMGAKVSNASNEVQHWMGLALMPQAGVAIGMALVTVNEYPEYKQIILPIVISTTVFFELVGPICTRIALKQTQ